MSRYYVIICKLRALRSVDLVLEHHELYNLSPGGGFSFSLSKVVDGTGPDADIVFHRDENDEDITYIEALGTGGILFQPADEAVDFGNSPEAPLSGYERKLRYPASQGGFYFVRTHDGKHYAKFFSPLQWTRSDGAVRRLDLANTEIIWAYQPNGTRDLENSPRTLPFPFDKFGVKRESLER